MLVLANLVLCAESVGDISPSYTILEPEILGNRNINFN